MSDSPKTMRVMPWSESQGEYVVINESDFDPAVHEKFDEAEEDSAEPKKRGRKPKQVTDTE